MLNKVDALIPSSMESPIEDELSAGEDIDNDYDDGCDIVFLDSNSPLNFDVSVENEAIPLEINDYVTSIETQTKRLEQELEECDDLLNFDPHCLKPRSDGGGTVMVCDNLQELTQAAAEAGMTVEAFKEKLLRDIDEDSFDEEVMDTEHQEITDLRTELEETRQEIDKLNDSLDQEVNAFLEDRGKRLQGFPVAIEDGCKSPWSEGGPKRVENIVAQEPTPVPQDGAQNGVGHLVKIIDSTDFREFIRRQLKETQIKADERRLQLRKMFDIQQQKEEETLLKQEEYRKEFNHSQRREAEMLMERKTEAESRIENEIKNNEKLMEEEYENFQANLGQLNAAYEEEKRTFDNMRKLMTKQLDERQAKAARDIQRIYKGYRTRRVMQAAIQDLAEMKELRRKEKEKIRVMEIQYEMDVKAEEQKREREQKEEEERKVQEDLKQQELDKQRKEKDERNVQEDLKQQELDKQRKEKDERKVQEYLKQQELDKQRKEKEERKVQEYLKQQELDKQRKEKDERKVQEYLKQQELDKPRKEDEDSLLEDEKRKKENEKKEDAAKKEEEKKNKQR